MPDLHALTLSGSDIAKVKAVVDSLLAESGVRRSAVFSLGVARSILSAYKSGVTDTHELLIYGRAIAKGQMH